MDNFNNTTSESESESEESPYADAQDPPSVTEAKKEPPKVEEFTYTERDVILYNLGIGATEQELQWVFESHEDFSALPTFGVIPQMPTSSGLSLDFLPNYNPVRLHHQSFSNISLSWYCADLVPSIGQIITRRTIPLYQRSNPNQRNPHQHRPITSSSR